jgi:hypothetical protein
VTVVTSFGNQSQHFQPTQSLCSVEMALTDAALIGLENIDDVACRAYCGRNSTPAVVSFNDFANRPRLSDKSH